MTYWTIPSAVCVSVIAHVAAAQTLPDGTSDPMADPVAYQLQTPQDQGSLTAGIWYSQAEAASVSLGIEQDKLFGTDENFRLGLEASGYTQIAHVTSTDPDFYESIYSRQLAFSLTNLQPNRTQNGDYSFSSAEASIGFGRHLTPDLAISFGLGVAQTRIEDSVDLPVFIRDYISAEGETNSSAFTFINLFLDRSDGSADPMHGYQIGWANELGTVSGTTYLKSQANAHYYHPFLSRGRLHLRGDIALGEVIGSGTYPIYDNFYAGGPGSVRGFSQNTLGPTSAIPNSAARAYSGGAFRVTGGAELSQKFTTREDVHALAFFDFGNVFSDMSTARSDDLRSAIGIGLRWDSPIGAINIYYAQALNDRASDETEPLQFTLGTRF
ncbi:hypothetical protein BFP70_10740 [Thioclava sp. SK-1]|uniref:BamA/OMP85 family outer membrane protein n=1 Tax=Thioclava sp. SK-1 TaxID=1889770 RepID=UPI000825A0E7|nr:BamA/TamA family outer membrane protein [Thioclava sp. SK-1]OCX64509.1 hypothetical protein BFP70_10740 [Thioclava sp. SK-1]